MHKNTTNNNGFRPKRQRITIADPHITGMLMITMLLAKTMAACKSMSSSKKSLKEKRKKNMGFYKVVLLVIRNVIM